MTTLDEIMEALHDNGFQSIKYSETKGIVPELEALTNGPLDLTGVPALKGSTLSFQPDKDNEGYFWLTILFYDEKLDTSPFGKNIYHMNSTAVEEVPIEGIGASTIYVKGQKREKRTILEGKDPRFFLTQKKAEEALLLLTNGSKFQECRDLIEKHKAITADLYSSLYKLLDIYANR